MWRNNNKGYTIFEVIMVLVIAGMLASIALPMVFWTPEKTLKNTTRRFLTEIYRIRNSAVKNNNYYLLVYRPAISPSFMVINRSNCAPYSPSDTTEFFIDIDRNMTNSGNISFKDSSGIPQTTLEICFYPIGSVSSQSIGTIVFRINNGGIQNLYQNISISSIGIPSLGIVSEVAY